MHIHPIVLLTALTAATPILPGAAPPSNTALQSIIASLEQTSTAITTNSTIVSDATRHLSYDLSSNLDPITELTNAINQVAHALWGAAYAVEQHVDDIGASSVSGRDVAAAEGLLDSLKSALTEKTHAVKKLGGVLKGAVDGITHVAMAFTSSEKKAVEDAIKASAKAAEAFLKPIGKLGGKVKGVQPVVDELKGVLKGLVGFANGVKLPDW